MAEGFRTFAFRCAGGEIVRVGRSDAQTNTFQGETDLMATLRPQLSFSIPTPVYSDDGSDLFPFGVMVYPGIDGKCPEAASPALADSIADALRQIHGASVPDGAPQVAPDAEEVRRLAAEVGEHAQRATGPILQQWLEDFLGVLSNFPRRVVIHGDFWYENWLVERSSQRLVGVLDFERCGVGFPHQDFTPLRYLGDQFRRDVLCRYFDQDGELPTGLERQIQAFDVFRELGGLAWALHHPQAEEIEASMEKVYEVLGEYGEAAG